MTGGERLDDVRMAFYTRYVSDVPTRRFVLTPNEVLLLNPNTGTLPVFRTRRDAEVTLSCYRRHPVLIQDRDSSANAWGLSLGRMLHMADDSGMFRSSGELLALGASFTGWDWTDDDGHRWLPLYEAKMVTRFDHRFTTYDGATRAQLNKGSLPHVSAEQHDDPSHESLARYWVSESDLEAFIAAKKWPPHGWLLGWRDIAAAVNEGTFFPAVIPRAPASGLWFAIPGTAQDAAVLQSVWSSSIWDFLTRQKVAGTHVTLFIAKQLACPPPSAFDATPLWSASDLYAFVLPRVLELTYTSHRIRPYAEDVVGGDAGDPFRWLPIRRGQLRAEIDAAMFHLYALDRPDAEHVLDSFFVLRKYEERDHGEFRTKRLVLTVYDAMTAAAESGVPFVSPLDPQPGDGPRHPERQP